MSLSGRAAWMAGAVVVVALTAVTAYDNELPAGGFHDVRDSPCFPCHVTWDPPLSDFAAIVPGADASAAVGESFEYSVLIQNTYLSDLRENQPSLDISRAPSLQFVTDQQPLLGTIIAGIVPAAPDATALGARSSFEVIEVEAGVTDLHITLEPDNRDSVLGPDIVLNLFPASENADGQPGVGPIDDAGAGGPESFHITGAAALSELGFGPWAVEAEVKGLTSTALGGATDVPFTITVDKYYNATGEAVKFLQRTEVVPPSGSTVFTWELQVVAAPGPDEVVRIANNATSYWEHDDSSTVDWGYTHNEVEVPVVAVGEGAGFGTSAEGPIVIVTPDVGVSMARISEIVGYVSAFLVLASIYTGGMFGKKSRRQLNAVFESAKRRVAFHNFLSYGIILAATVHTVIFLWPGIDGNYHWTVGLIWGLISILMMFGLGITGALQVPLIRRWNYSKWRWTHLLMSYGVIVFTILHMVLDGGNFGAVQDAVNWTNPLDPRDV